MNSFVPYSPSNLTRHLAVNGFGLGLAGEKIEAKGIRHATLPILFHRRKYVELTEQLNSVASFGWEAKKL